MLRIKNLLSIVALLFACSVQVQAAPITTLFNTGVDAAGVSLADATIGDPHYSLIAVPGGTTDIRVRTSVGGFPIPPYIGDSATSAWIGPNNAADLDSPAGNYLYRTTFDLTGFNLLTTSINGLWATDDRGVDILINGISTGFFSPFSAVFTPFAINSGFIAGINTLDFQVNNAFGGPTALRVEFSNPLAVPEPSIIALLALGLIGLWYTRRKVNLG